MRADRQDDRAIPGRERHESLDERRGEGDPPLERKELAKRDELDLVIDGDRFPVGVQLKGRVVEFRRGNRLAPDHLIAAQQNRNANLTRERAQRRVPLWIVARVLKGEWRGRFG